MNLGPIKTGDVVEVDIRGERFFALATDEGVWKKGQLAVNPIGGGRGELRVVTAREVVAHYRRSRRSR